MTVVHSIDDLAGDDGLVVGVAIDHRDALHAALARRGMPVDAAFVAQLKSRVVAALSPDASVVLVDHAVGLPRVLADHALAPGTALAVPLEQQGYGALHEVVVTTTIDDFGPAEARDAGASAVKLLLPFRIDRAQQAARQVEVARYVIERCHQAGIPLILEPVVAVHPDDPVDDAYFGELVVRGAERLAGLGPHVLKLQYPGTFERCAQMTTVCGTVPWVLLGGGVEIDELEPQIGAACRAGARGFIVGRSLWNGALHADLDVASEHLQADSRPLLRRLVWAARNADSPRLA